MKNYSKVLVFAAVVALVAVPAFAAKGGADASGLCSLIAKMQGIFRTLRVLAFVGAGFYMADWAWGWISTAKDGVKMDDVKKKGTALLVGFGLLFLIGVVLSFLLSAAGDGNSLGCEGVIKDGWNKAVTK